MHDLMPLDLAVRTIFRRVYDKPQRVGASPRDLDGLAYMIAGVWPIFAYEPDGGAVRQLSQDELSHGLFRGGARELYFVDSRPAARNLAVRVSTIQAAVATLRQALP